MADVWALFFIIISVMIFRRISWMSWITIQPASLSLFLSFLLQSILPQMWAQHFHGSMNCLPTLFFFTVSHSSRLLCSVQVAMRKCTINTLEALVSYSLICLRRGSVESIFTQWEDVLGTRILSLFWIFFADLKTYLLYAWTIRCLLFLSNRHVFVALPSSCQWHIFCATILLFWQLHSFFFSTKLGHFLMLKNKFSLNVL